MTVPDFFGFRCPTDVNFGENNSCRKLFNMNILSICAKSAYFSIFIPNLVDLFLVPFETESDFTTDWAHKFNIEYFLRMNFETVRGSCTLLIVMNNMVKQSASKYGRRTFPYSAMREQVCNGNFRQERL